MDLSKAEEVKHKNVIQEKLKASIIEYRTIYSILKTNGFSQATV